MNQSRSAQPGFTLIEVLIVVAVIGILAVVVLPSTAPDVNAQLRTAARMVATELAYARSLAVSNNSTYRVTFDTEDDRLVIEHSGVDSGLDVLPDSPFRDPEDPRTQHVLDLTDVPRLGAPVRLVTAAENTGVFRRIDHIQFGPLGELSSTGRVVLWLSSGPADGQHYVYLTVDPVTGLAERGGISTQGPPR
ncbi:MAG: pilus assembly FimT family protein [Pirellulales bacterium]